MKAFVTPLPASNNVKGSGLGSPASDMNKISNALVEVRSSVPSTPADIGAVTNAQVSSLVSRVNALIARLNALKVPMVSDEFSRTTLGGDYVVTGTAPTMSSGRVVFGAAATTIVATKSTRTYNMYARVAIVVDSTSIAHPSVLINYDDTAKSYYRALYNVANSRWEINKMVNGVETNIGFSPATKPTSTYDITLKQENGTLKLLQGSEERVVTSDAVPLKEKRAGMLAAAVTNAGTRAIETFSYGDL